MAAEIEGANQKIEEYWKKIKTLMINVQKHQCTPLETKFFDLIKNEFQKGNDLEITYSCLRNEITVSCGAVKIVVHLNKVSDEEEQKIREFAEELERWAFENQEYVFPEDFEGDFEIYDSDDYGVYLEDDEGRKYYAKTNEYSENRGCSFHDVRKVIYARCHVKPLNE